MIYLEASTDIAGIHQQDLETVDNTAMKIRHVRGLAERRQIAMIENASASASECRIRTPTPRLDVRAIAHEIAMLILTGADDERIEWKGGDRQKVKVLSKAILPWAVRQTAAERRRRFYRALDAELGRAGYGRSGAIYRRNTEIHTCDTEVTSGDEVAA